MPSINFNNASYSGSMHTEIIDGLLFAQTAIQFASLGLTAQQSGWKMPRVHLFALAIELAFKSLAIRSGATVPECKKAGHKISKIIALIERKGTCIPDLLKNRLDDDEWFEPFLFLSRYPTFTNQNTSAKNTIFLHSDYPELIAAILEIPCKWPLTFEGENALSEITMTPPRRN